MGGAVCAKQIIDQGAGNSAVVTKVQAAVDKALKCLTATVYVAPDKTASEPMVEKMLEAGRRFELALRGATDSYLGVVQGLEAEARGNWPSGDQESREGGGG